MPGEGGIGRRPKGGEKDEDEEDLRGLAVVEGAEHARTGSRRCGGGSTPADPPGNAISWRAVLGRLVAAEPAEGVLRRAAPACQPISYPDLLQPGKLSVVDLSDSGFSELNNLVIADLLRGLQDGPGRGVPAFEAAAGRRPRRGCWS